MKKNISISLLAISTGAALANPLGFQTYSQELVVKYPTAAEAANASASIPPLPNGAVLAFTSRWDDSNPNHVPRAKMYNSIGYTATFFLNKNEDFYKKEAIEMLKEGSVLANHSATHPFLMQIEDNEMHIEVLENKIAIESICDTSCVSFGAPFNWESEIDESRPSVLRKIIIGTGHYVSGDWVVENCDVPADTWMTAHLFSANDTNPNEELFENNLSSNIQKAKGTPEYPRISFGIHSWCDEQELAKQCEWLKRHGNNPDWFYANDNQYGAYRYQYYHSKLEKISSRGNTVVWRLTRFMPLQLGSDYPLSISFSGAPTEVKLDNQVVGKTERGFYTLPHSSEFTGALTVLRDAEIEQELLGISFKLVRNGFKQMSIQIKNSTSNPIVGAHTTFFLPPAFEKARIVKTSDPNSEISGEATIAANLGALIKDPNKMPGKVYFAACVDFFYNSKPFRVYLTEIIPELCEKNISGDTPRDTAHVLGPISRESFDEAAFLKMATPDAELENFGDAPNEQWRCTPDTSRFGYAAIAYIPWTVDKAYKEAIGPFANKNGVRLLATDFISPKDGELTLKINKAQWEAFDIYLNGVKTTVKGKYHTLNAKKGRNRLVLNVPMPNNYHANTVLFAIYDGELENPVKFLKPMVKLPDNVIDNPNGMSAKFGLDGQLQSLKYKGTSMLGRLAITGSPKLTGSLEGKSFDWSKIISQTKLTKFVKEARDELAASAKYPIEIDGELAFTLYQKAKVEEGIFSIKYKLVAEKDISWTGKLIDTDVYIPLDLIIGSDFIYKQKGKDAVTRKFPAEFDGSFQPVNLEAMEYGVNPKIKLSFINAVNVGFLDRRQWNQNSISLRVVPNNTCIWGGEGRLTVGPSVEWGITLDCQ